MAEARNPFPVLALLLSLLLLVLLEYSSAAATSDRCGPIGEFSHGADDKQRASEVISGGACRNYSVTDNFLRLEEIYNYLDCLKTSYPHLVRVKSMGRSFHGRQLKYIDISYREDCRSPVQKPAIFIDAGIHAREWIGPAVALNTIFQLVENHTANSDLIAAADWYILPVANPDGYEYTFTNNRFWRKTLSTFGTSSCIGVDMNRNFRFHWGESSSDPCSMQFHGSSPESELETAALAKFLRGHRDNIRLYLSFHSFGPMLLTPWGFTKGLPDDDNDIMKLGELALDALKKIRGTDYQIGSSANVLYPSYGSSRDYAKHMGIKYAYTMELPPGGRRRFDPPTEDIAPVAMETFQAIRVFGKFIGETCNSVGNNSSS